ncbi:MAG: thiamine pyrophosphate-dependent dehydrogenase E1 component subunit alpha [Myxococcota bacterium]
MPRSRRKVDVDALSFQVLREDGTLADGVAEPDVDAEMLFRIYRTMALVRTLDERMMALQRQGRVGFYGAATGQEAAIVGSAAALEPHDWVLPALRESGVALFRGYPLRKYVAQVMGNANDILKGRQLACHYGDRSVHYVPMSSNVGTQIPHAVGAAMAAKLRRDRTVVIGYMGDGATSTQDFHVAMNFAGVLRPPVVLFCQNNQFSISVPVRLQTASETIAEKALAYGFEGLRVDGNDAIAVYLATRYAVDKARGGGGPTFIEALTYRIGAHSSSDDPSRYRDESVTAEWRTRRDPLARLRAFLMARGALTEEKDAALRKQLDDDVRAAIADEEPVGPPAVETMFEDVYARMPPHLQEQLAEHTRRR